MKLKRLEVNSFGGIHPASPVVIDFTQSKWVTAKGDMGLGKSSLLNAMLVACGALSKENKNFINNESGKIDINFDFVGKDRCNYSLRVTKSALTLKYEGETVSEPVSKLKELLGAVGSDPMEIKYKPLKDIVKWLASYSNKTPEGFEELLLKYKTGIATAREKRAQSNKGFKTLDEYLKGEEMFINWEESEKKYVTRPNLKELSAQLEIARKNSDNLNRATEQVTLLKNRVTEIDKQIAALQEEKKEKEGRIQQGDIWLEENKTAHEDYGIVKKRYENLSQELLDFNKWESIKEKKQERDEFETLAQRFDAQEKSLLQELKELQAEILPDLKNISLVLEDTHEDGKQVKEGLYVDGKNVAQLSESEWIAFVIQLWRKFKVKVVVLDNIGVLGSKGIEALEKLNKDGAYILAAEMSRQTKELTISYE